MNEHVPLAVAKLGGKTRIVATKVLGSPQGPPPFYRVAEIYFPSTPAGETLGGVTVAVCDPSKGDAAAST